MEGAIKKKEPRDAGTIVHKILNEDKQCKTHNQEN
jgi:hypothetical protein